MTVYVVTQHVWMDGSGVVGVFDDERAAADWTYALAAIHEDLTYSIAAHEVNNPKFDLPE